MWKYTLLVALLASGCVAEHSFDLTGSTGGNPDFGSSKGDDPVTSDADNDAEQDADDRDDSGDSCRDEYSPERSVFHKSVESIGLDIQRSFRLEGTGAARKCIRARIARVGLLDYESELEISLRNCGGFITAEAVKAANGGASCKGAELSLERVEFPTLSVRRVLGIRPDCVCYYGQRVETIALRVEKLRFARPGVCAQSFDEYRKLLGP